MQKIWKVIVLLILAIESNSQTNLEMNSVFGGNAVDEAKDIAINNTNTALFIGARSFSNDGDVGSNAGSSDFWIMKRDVNGSLLWSKTYGAVSSDDLEVLLPHPDGGVIAFGTTRTDQGLFGDLNGLAGAWLMRTNNNGTLINGQIIGGSLTELAIDAYRHLNGNITLAIESGSPTLNGENNNGLTDVAIVQVNQNLTEEWTLVLGGASPDMPRAITSDINGNIYVAAISESNLPGMDPNQGGADIWVIKVAPDGEVLWQRTFGGSEDDLSSDIVYHPDGYVYLLAHSSSDDGDFGSNYGINDIWMIKLDETDGATLSMYQYGGSANDLNAHADLYFEDKLVITASTTSQDTNLTGNKGLSDVWVFTTDLNGQVLSQMNYGGSLQDFTVDLLTIDSAFHVLATTQSTDKNVPVNTLAQSDLWYFTLNPFPDSCSTQFVCMPDSSLSNQIAPPSNEALLCISGCTAGYGHGPIFNDGSCVSFLNSTAYFFVSTDANADLLTISVNSHDFNEPQIALLRSVNCTTFIPVECTTGEAGHALISYIDVDPLTTYVVAVTDAAGNVGEFEFCATAVDVEFCNKDDRIYVYGTSMGSPFSGPFKPGEEVQICYELEEWEKLDCNGFQGLVPSFGPGWDTTYLDLFGQPIHMDSLLAPVTTGFWAWYKVGDVRYNVSNPINGYDGGQGMPAGWFFTNTAHPPPNDGPDQTTGDINDCLPASASWKVCFTLKVVDECETNLDCSVTMKTFSDGELGAESSLGCAYDQEEVLHRSMRCCLNPSIDHIQDFTICSGDTIAFAPETNLMPPVKYTWNADPDPFITGASSGTNLPQFYQILESDVQVPVKVRYSIRAEGNGCFTEPENFEVTILPRPTSRITLTGPSIVCSGETVTFNFESTGTPPFAIELFRDNEPFANILSESTFLTLDIDPVFSGRFRVGNVEDNHCEGQGLGFVDIIVKPVSHRIIDTVLCDGQTIEVGGETFDESGIYTITLTDGAENNCDSVIMLSLNYAPTLTETIIDTICGGDTLYVLDEPYTEPIDTLIEYTGPEGCPNFIHLQLTVRDTMFIEIDQTICFGDTLEFGGIGVYEPGDYFFTEEIRPGCYEQTILHLHVLPAIIINDLVIIGDDGNDNGSILVEVVGGTPDFTYLWNTGATTESLFNIMHGAYTLTVTDELGCREVFEFEVPFVNATKDLREQFLKLQVRPNPAHTDQQIFLVNTAGEILNAKALRWQSTTGQSVQYPLNLTLDPGSQLLLQIPDNLSGGLYYLAALDTSGMMYWTKIVLVR